MTESYSSRFLQFRFLDDVSETRKGRYKPKVILVLGARQTGKSTLLNHCIGKVKRTFYLNLQDRRLRRRYETDEGLLLRELSVANSIYPVFAGCRV